MLRRLTICLTALCPFVSGCAMDRPLLDRNGPVFANQTLAPILGTRGHETAAGGYVQEAQVHQTATTWNDAEVIPAVADAGFVETDDFSRYLLDSGDRLRIFVYGQPNLSRVYVVDHQGRISVPLIGEVNARGMTTYGLKSVISQRLEADFVRDPHVTVDIHQARPFFILGEVRNAGQFPYVSGMTIETAVAIAGGYTERASMRSYRVTRRVNGYTEKIDVPADFTVQPGDTVFVHERFF